MAGAPLLIGVQEPDKPHSDRRVNPINRANLRRLPAACWWVVGIGAACTQA